MVISLVLTEGYNGTLRGPGLQNASGISNIFFYVLIFEIDIALYPNPQTVVVDTLKI